MSEGLIAAVLAGGAGRRMGGLKALRPFRGTTLVAHAVRLARHWSDQVVVVVRDPSQAAGAVDAPLVLDAPEIDGPLAGLAAALAHAQASGADLAITLPCDTPDLPHDLAARLRSAMEPDAYVAMPEVAGKLEPALGLWRVEVLARLAAYAGAGRTSLKGFAAEVGLTKVEFGADMAARFANANTLEALAALDPRAEP